MEQMKVFRGKNTTSFIGGGNVVVFDGPDREANAALFVRAQHMGELVEAAKELHHVAHKCLAVFVPSADGASEELSDAMRKVRAILAKIGGGE